MSLILSGLKISLGGTVLVALEATILPGEVLTVMGPSGSGKSSLLAALTGNLAPAFRLQGRIVLNGRDLTGLAPQDRRVGLLFQDDVLFPHLSVGGNLGFALPRSVAGRAARKARIDAALAEAGLQGFAPRDPATLSGGQRARVALLRTLLSDPQALLLDEPFSRLDADLRASIRSLVLGRARSLGLPVVLVTHDVEDARAAGGPVVDPLGRAIAV